MDQNMMNDKPVEDVKPVDNAMPSAETPKKDDAESVKKATDLLTQASTILAELGEDYSEDVMAIDDMVKSLTKEEDTSSDADITAMQDSKKKGSDFMDQLMG